MFGPQYWHFVGAAYMTAGYVVAGRVRGRLAARPPGPLPPARLHRAVHRRRDPHARAVRARGLLARSVFHKQPVKFAATEIVWKTDTHDPSTSSAGCSRTDDLRRDQDPPTGLDPRRIQPGHRGDRADAGAGRATARPPARPPSPTGRSTHGRRSASLLMLLALWYGWCWLRRRDLPRSRWFYRCAAVAGVGLGGHRGVRLDHHRGGPPALDRLPEHAGLRGGHGHPRRPVWAMFAIVVVVYVLVVWVVPRPSCCGCASAGGRRRTRRAGAGTVRPASLARRPAGSPREPAHGGEP